MTPLPAVLGGDELAGWRIDQARFGPTWDSGEGAYLAGGRWNSRGRHVVYCSVDPATAILEVAVHKGFRALDMVPHVLTSFVIGDPSQVHVVKPSDIPNPHWLRPAIPSAGQQEFGDRLLSEHLFVLIPSAVSTHSWNLLFDSRRASSGYVFRSQEAFALDPRLHPPGA